VALEENAPDVAALVLLSPNFALKDWRAKFISGPLGRLLARALIGEEYSFRPDNPSHAEFWSPRYPSDAIVALMDLTNYARRIRLSDLMVPTLVIYTDRDTIVEVDAIRSRFAEIGHRRKRIVNLPGATRHELTGNALAPQTVDLVVRQIRDFLSDP
jgi:alpha-beta hydrolase superfamily lysophospholipase